MITTTLLAMVLSLHAPLPASQPALIAVQQQSAMQQRTDSIAAHLTAHPKRKAAAKSAARTASTSAGGKPSKGISKFGGVAKSAPAAARTKSKPGKG